VSSAANQAERLEPYGGSLGRTIGAILLLAALAGVVWVWFGMVKLDRWPIRWLEVDGAFERVSAEQVRKAAAPLVNESFFSVDPQAIQAAARELPWVNQVVVEKTWPDTIRLYVTEYVPVAHWVDGQLIATNGDTFSVPRAEGIQGLPWLEGPTDSATQVIEAWLAFNDLLQPAGQVIERITLDPRGAWTLKLVQGTTVNIGREDAMARVKRLANAWYALRDLRGVAPVRVDLRYSNGFAVQWPESFTDESPDALADNR
jgi:cell division protein FtsQ